MFYSSLMFNVYTGTLCFLPIEFILAFIFGSDLRGVSGPGETPVVRDRDSPTLRHRAPSCNAGKYGTPYYITGDMFPGIKSAGRKHRTLLLPLPSPYKFSEQPSSPSISPSLYLSNSFSWHTSLYPYGQYKIKKKNSSPPCLVSSISRFAIAPGPT